jgi:MFS family permease
MQSQNQAMRKFYLSVGLRHFGISLISIFIPAYLYSVLSFSIPQILLFLFIQESLTILFDFIAAKYISKKGARNSILISFPLLLLSFYFLPLSASPLFMFLSAAFRAGFGGFYWPAFHTYLGSHAPEGKTGDATGKTWSWYMIAIILGPLVGGFILQYFGYYYLYALFCITQIAAVLVLPELKVNKFDLDFKKTFHRLTMKEKSQLFFQGASIEAIDLWSLYSFILVPAFALLGAIKFIAGLFSSLYSFAFGKIVDKYGSSKTLSFAWLFNSINWGWKYFAQGQFGVIIGDFLGNISFLSMESPIMSKLYTEGRKNHDLLERIVLREAILRLSILPLLLLAFFVGLQNVFAILGIAFIIVAAVYGKDLG